MVSCVHTSAICGVDAISVDVEVELSEGKAIWTIVGLGDGAVRESRERVLAALTSSGCSLPCRVLVNLAPAEIKKEGSSFDLAIAVGVLTAMGFIRDRERLRSIRFHGELSLDGSLKPVRGMIALTIEAVRSGAKEIIVPRANVREAILIEGIKVVGVASLRELSRYLRGEPVPPELPHQEVVNEPPSTPNGLSQVWGQQTAKRAMTIAAAGGHNLLMIGPPGCGKSMLAERFPSILPALTREEMLETVKIHSIAGQPIKHILGGIRPYRSPHHVVSDVGLVGGGPSPKPGEISLAHHGVLFLDEFPEYRRTALEALRAPLEVGRVVITRAKATHTFPARFQLVAAMNPCPCGRLGIAGAHCACSPMTINNYLRKLSQPILDRIDLHVEMEAVPFSVMTSNQQGDGDDVAVKNRIQYARTLQLQRVGVLNAHMNREALAASVKLDSVGTVLLENAGKRIGLSARTFTRILKVARTIADLDKRDEITSNDIAEAISFRTLERIQTQR